ncbi:ketoacyl-ACP synthase III [Chryseobacterium indologenes]|uniref:Ketoacyl-ACP synthase III n=1 Tax=Chryseobacterium indologenes TaxID=253 RepID=A0AAD1DVX0_CHRID|nr:MULTISPECIES: ketoacyl-ACP synthase III [Chryseobacterium]AYZ37528.1 ketoacyl-ACP synthase III [Chryseobacterium indologenes]AZB19270.1 ketoacyl-ACP synthase III [Chryseobacterium indologenes]MBF6646401.1 ketoacyl-ACP synthase III [Chryseobacterium indologenes]MBU3049541.1 ketoacyl-ACP synthase III [Chryseobacterium indologenes]MEB4761898.1 ketoacyl-ACP synthase III [Chryseobacterium indologenes]
MIKISKIEYYLPEYVLTNEDLEKEFPEWSSDRIKEKVGITERHVAAENETVLDLAIQSSKKLFESYDKNKIDFILFCTQSPDYFLPTTACILQDKLGLRKNIGAMDFNLGCSGFVYGLAFAKGLIAAGIAQSILLVTSETYTKHIHPKDKGNRSIFGDASASVIVEKDDTAREYKFCLGTDGSGAENLIVKKGAFRTGFELNPDHEFEAENLYMNGPEIFNFTIENIPGLVKETMETNGVTMEEIDYFVFHQANSFMLNYLRKKIKIPAEKFYIDMEKTGNTVSATIPIALKNMIDKGMLKGGEKVLMAGFGVGYSWGATLVEM